MLIDIKGTPIDPIWAAEFRGFFFGDGFLGIVRNGKSRWTGEISMTARAQITLRDDDSDILLAIHARIGGAITREGSKLNKRPTMIWRTRSRSEVERVCDLLEGAALPSKKLAEVAVMRRFLAIKVPPSRRCIGVDYAGMLATRLGLMAEMQRLHAYRDVTDSGSPAAKA